MTFDRNTSQMSVSPSIMCNFTNLKCLMSACFLFFVFLCGPSTWLMRHCCDWLLGERRDTGAGVPLRSLQKERGATVESLPEGPSEIRGPACFTFTKLSLTPTLLYNQKNLDLREMRRWINNNPYRLLIKGRVPNLYKTYFLHWFTKQNAGQVS